MTLLALPALSACGEAEPWAATGRHEAAIVYGRDDRSELFERAFDERASIADSAVALVPRRALMNGRGPRLAVDVPSWEHQAGLCPGEPFGDQPAPAFCSGVLVDWDLVLTVAHCVEGIDLDDVALLMGFYYVELGVLGTTEADVLQPVAVVDQFLDEETEDAVLDYAWIRLARPAPPWRRPAPLRATARPLVEGESLALMGSPGGTPQKLDFGGSVLDARPEQLDYFTADTDTSGGSSGSGAYDPELVLAGLLARGGTDFTRTLEGCLVMRREPAAGEVREELTYVHRALEGLCAHGEDTSSLCRSDCGDPCEALARPESRADEGCSLSAGTSSRVPPLGTALGALLLAGSSYLRRTRRLNHSGS